jgi:HTH-type transcriptional regulator/antitoxin HigA
MNSKDLGKIGSIDEPSHPGATLQDILEERGMTQLELAERIGLDKKTVNLIINGNAPISQDTALALELIFETPAHAWLELEIRYQESVARKAEDHKLCEYSEWVQKFPYNQMASMSWIPATKVMTERARNLLKFFSVANPKSWEEVYMNGLLEASYRRPSMTPPNSEIVSSWLRRGEILAQETENIPDFNKDKFSKSISEMRSYTLIENLTEAIEKLKLKCAECGVVYLHVEELPSLSVSGVMRWIKNRPVIIQTLRYKTNDQFWFTFFHEAFHVLQNQKKTTFLDGTDLLQEDLQRETEADFKARELLIPNQSYVEYLANTRTLTIASIKDFAKTLVIHPAIVVGRLQHDGKIPWRHHASKLKISLKS